MPHSCFGALTHHYTGVVAFLMSDDAVKIIEVMAAGGAIYKFTWKPLRKVLLPIMLALIMSVTVSTLDTRNLTTFADRLKQACWGPAKHLPSPEPVKSSSQRHAKSFSMGGPRQS